MYRERQKLGPEQSISQWLDDTKEKGEQMSVFL